MVNGLSLHINVLRKTPIPMYGTDVKSLARYIIKSKKNLSKATKIAPNIEACTAIICNGEWYEQNYQFCKTVVRKNLPEWKHCEIWRDLQGIGIVVVLALRPNKNPSSRINKRVVDRAYNQTHKPICAYTRTKLKRQNASAEHIIPLSSGGNNSVWNICVACTELNNERGNMNFWNFWRSVLASKV